MQSIIHTYQRKTISNFGLVTSSVDRKSAISIATVFSNQKFKLILDIKIISFLN